MSVHPTSANLTVLQLSGSAANAPVDSSAARPMPAAKDLKCDMNLSPIVFLPERAVLEPDMRRSAPVSTSKHHFRAVSSAITLRRTAQRDPPATIGGHLRRQR